MGFFAFDGDGYQLDGEHFKNGVKKTADLRKQGYTWKGLPDQQRAQFEGTEDWEAFEKGEIAVAVDGTWLFGAVGKTINFDLAYKGALGGRTVLIPGYIQSRWEGETGLKIGDKENATIGDVMEQAIAGEINYADYAKQIAMLSNQRHQQAKETITEALQ